MKRKPFARSLTLPLSSAQERLWFLQEMEPESAGYNISRAHTLNGPLDVEALAGALAEVVKRHGSLRTSFLVQDGRPVQRISDAVPFTLARADFSALPETARLSKAQRLMETDAATPFELAQAPLLRVRLVRLAEQEHVLVLTMHGIVSDSWSIPIFERELSMLYNAAIRKTATALPELPIQYADYAIWQRDHLRGKILAAELSYWKRQLHGAPSVVDLPSDRPRLAVQSIHGASEERALTASLVGDLKNVSQRHDATLFMTLLAAFQTLLSRYCGQCDISVGSPTAGRARPGTEDLIGLFANALVFRTDLSGDPTFVELLARVREVALRALSHQDLPFEKVVEGLRPERSLSHAPLFQVGLELHGELEPALGLEGVTATPLEIESRGAEFDLNLSILPAQEGLRARLIYSTDLFDRSTARRILGHFVVLLRAVAEDPGRRLSELPLLTDSERRQVLVEWNATGTEYPRGKTLHGLFEEQAQRTPAAEAVVFAGERLTYGQLNESANRLARYLRKRGVGPEVLVGLCVERSLEMVVGILGILKAGGAYVPLDPTYPRQRLAFELEDTGTRLVLTQESLRESLPEGQFERVRLDTDWPQIAQESAENPSSEPTAESLAYVIYTSGSTGKPKGVEVTHRALANHTYAVARRYGLGPTDRVLQFASLAFDVAAEELFPTWLAGATVVLRPEAVGSDVAAFSRFLATGRLTVVNLPAAFWQEWVGELARSPGEAPASLRLVITGSERVSLEAWDSWRRLVGSRVRWLNAYGLTECTITATLCEPDPSAALENVASVPIGRPIANTQVYLLDERGGPVPVGVRGELHIGGEGLARGYRGHPEWTREKFVPNPFSSEAGSRLYKTGDLARFLPDGNIECLGRIDDQVKIRGYRIEPAEIEDALANHPDVLACAVAVWQETSEDKRLIGYVVARGERPPSVSELRTFLKERLPDYLVPPVFVFLGALPLTPNGKVDRAALPAPGRERPDRESKLIAPRNALESKLVRICERILDVRPVSVTDNFFELGGHSLLAVRLLVQIEKAIGKRLPLSAIFEAQTVEQLAARLQDEKTPSSWSSLVAIQPGGLRPPFYCVHALGRDALEYRDLARHLGPARPLYGLHPHGLDGKLPPHERVEDMAAHYIRDIRAIQPEGPYYLGGWSFGGNIAFEMAQQLQAAGQKVAFLALIDAENVPAKPPSPESPVVVGSLGFISRRIRFHLEMLGRLESGARLPYFRKKASIAFRWIWLKLGKFYQSIRHPMPEAAYAATERAAERYVPKPYEGSVTLFCTSEWVTTFHDPYLGWGSLCPGGLETLEVPGDHYSVVTEPHVRTLARKIAVSLRRAEKAAAEPFRADVGAAASSSRS